MGVTPARTSAARFLGYEITVRHADHKLTRGRREVNGDIALRVPLPVPVIKAKIAPYMTRGKPAHRSRLMNDDDLAIIAAYGAEYRGVVQYYLLAGDVWRLNRLRWAAETSLLKTLAAKHRSTVTKMAAAYGTVIVTPHGPRRCFQASIDRGEPSARAGNHWSHGSAASPSNGSAKRSSPTASHPQQPSTARS